MVKWFKGTNLSHRGMCNVQCGNTVNNICIVYLKVVSSHYKKNFGVVTMLTRLTMIISQCIKIPNHYVGT